MWNERLATANHPGLARLFFVVVPFIISALAGFDGGVFNVGNPDERTVLELASLVVEFTGGKASIEHLPPRDEDPQRRCPDISRMREMAHWEPKIGLREGVQRTIAHYREQLGL